jgi:hypothetical protein
MTQFVGNIIQNSLAGFVSGAVTTAGGYAGDAIASAADLIEKKGQVLGDGIAPLLTRVIQANKGFFLTCRNCKYCRWMGSRHHWYLYRSRNCLKAYKYEAANDEEAFSRAAEALWTRG